MIMAGSGRFSARGLSMDKTAVVILMALLLAPAAQAAGVDAPDTPTLPGVSAQERLADAARGIAAAASQSASASATALANLGAGIASLARAASEFTAHATAATLRLAANAITAIATMLGIGAVAGYEYVRTHPRESLIAAGGAGGSALLWALLKRYGGLLFLPLYTRLAPSEMLDNKARNNVYEYVRANPGAHPSGIASALRLGWGTVVYHLARLEETKLVTCKAAAHRKCYFVVGSDMNSEARTAVAAMAHDKAKLIVQTVRDTPGISQKDMAEKVGMSQALASWHVKRLVESGVLLTHREGRSNALNVATHVPESPAKPAMIAAVA